MCGRYVADSTPDEIAAYFEVAEVRADELPPSWNVAPTREVYTVAESTRGTSQSSTAAHPQRRLGTMKWGLVPSWSKDPGGGAKMINARSEGIATKPAFSKALARRRCIVPADAFYEWERRDDGTKQPYLVQRADGEMLAMAGVWEVWRDQSRPEGEDGWLRTCSVITTESTGTLTTIHTRCPVILQRDDWDLWLDRTVDDPDAVLPMLHPNAAELLDIVPVSTRVNDVRNDDATLIDRADPIAEAPSLF